MHDGHSKTGDPAVGSTRLVRCADCKFWNVWREHPSFGLCKSEITQEQVGTDPPAEILFGENFGCINGQASNSKLSSGGPADNRQQTEQAARRLLK